MDLKRTKLCAYCRERRPVYHVQDKHVWRVVTKTPNGYLCLRCGNPEAWDRLERPEEYAKKEKAARKALQKRAKKVMRQLRWKRRLERVKRWWAGDPKHG